VDVFEAVVVAEGVQGTGRVTAALKRGWSTMETLALEMKFWQALFVQSVFSNTDKTVTQVEADRPLGNIRTVEPLRRGLAVKDESP